MSRPITVASFSSAVPPQAQGPVADSLALVSMIFGSIVVWVLSRDAPDEHSVRAMERAVEMFVEMARSDPDRLGLTRDKLEQFLHLALELNAAAACDNAGRWRATRDAIRGHAELLGFGSVASIFEAETAAGFIAARSRIVPASAPSRSPLSARHHVRRRR